MELNLPEKLYYNIGEISKAFEIKPSLLRFWEKEFEDLNIMDENKVVSIDKNKEPDIDTRGFISKQIESFPRFNQIK